MNTESNKPHIFYGWVIVFGGLLIMITIGGIAWNCVSQFIKPVCAEMGFSRQAMSANSTVTALVNMAVSLLWGYILKNFSLRKLMRMAVFTLPLAYFGYSLAVNIWMFYACSLLLGVSLSMLMTLPLSMIISNWFDEKRGLAFGITFMGSGLGGMIFNPIVAAIITKYGWRMAYRSMAGVMFAAAFLSVFFLLKLRPEEMGLKSLGYEKTHTMHIAADGHEEPDDDEGELFKDLIKTMRFKAMAVSMCVACTAIGCITQCLSPHLTDNGYGVQTAAFLVSAGMAAMAVGKMVLGAVYDGIGTRKATILSLVCGLIGVMGMIFCKIPLALAAIFLGQGLGCSFGTVGVPVVVQNVFGKRDYGANFGFITACTSVGGAISPMFNGAAYDITGSYNPAFTIWAVLLAVSLVVFFALLPKNDKVKI